MDQGSSTGRELRRVGGWEHRAGGRKTDVRDRQIGQEIQSRAEDQRVRRMGTKRVQKPER